MGTELKAEPRIKLKMGTELEKELVKDRLECRPGCGACCIAPSISSSLPGMPGGKPGGYPCPHLTKDMGCALYGKLERPAVCASLRPSPTMCGPSREAALAYLDDLERRTNPK